MRLHPQSATILALALMLAACGGGSGSDAVVSSCPTSTDPPALGVPALVVTQQNALAVAADAADVALASGPDSAHLLWGTAEDLLGFIPGGQPPALALACPGGGMLSAAPAEPGNGWIELTACRLAAGGAVLSGHLRVRVVGNTVGPDAGKSSRTLDVGARDLVVEAADNMRGLSGDLQVQRDTNPRFTNTVLAGTALAYATCAESGTRSVTIRDYSYATLFRLPNPVPYQRKADARVETGIPGLGIAGYGLSTPDPLTDGLIRIGGSIAVQGAGSSLLLTTLPGEASPAGTRAFHLTADTNGDAVVDFSVDSITLDDPQPTTQ